MERRLEGCSRFEPLLDGGDELIGFRAGKQDDQAGIGAKLATGGEGALSAYSSAIFAERLARAGKQDDGIDAGEFKISGLAGGIGGRFELQDPPGGCR